MLPALRSPSGLFPANRHVHASIKDLTQGPVALTIEVTPKGDHELVVGVRG